MKCLQCHSDNDEAQKFCRMCGTKLQMTCPACKAIVLVSDKFCGECGFELKTKTKLKEPAKEVASERKYVTAMFADISGYTGLSERLDPEEVKDIVSHLFQEIAKVISKYEGFIEKFAGDAVMALFGVPWFHEDDPVRAIKAAQEIHRVVGALSLKIQETTSQPLAVHIGINTGLVVTGKIDLEDGMNHFAGDTLNVASRLCDLAKANETFVTNTTFSQAEGFFSFERLDSFMVKGRTKPVQVYKVLSSKELPNKKHRLTGLRADFTGREAEIASLQATVARLLNGKGSVICICGEAGTGKSRLIEEFKSKLDLGTIQWHEGHAYEFTQNMPYYPLIDLLNRILGIEEGDPLELATDKAEHRIKALAGDGEDVQRYLGEFLSLQAPEEENIGPEVWKSRFHKAVVGLLSFLVSRAPTVIILEDLHWADPSSLEFLRFLLAESQHPALFLFTYRPPLDPSTETQLKEMGEAYLGVRLKDLSPQETRQMVVSLLRTDSVPLPLQRFIHEKLGGNPFYVEEAINSLIESETLTTANGEWTFTGPLQEIVMPATSYGVITARLDRLDLATKEILQEASVIGRTFYYEVLERITASGAPLDQHLQRLKELGLIRVKSSHPDVEYSFKHALIQEAAYNNLLKKQRQNIHEHVGIELEKFFAERSLESWEILAFHFKRGRSVNKALNYLIKSGEKSLKRYSLEEAHQYYQEAYDLLSRKPARSKQGDILFIDLLIKWCLPFYYQGRFKSLTELLFTHVQLAESLDDSAKKGAYYAWLGHSTFWQGDRLTNAYQYLRRGLALGEQTGDQQVIAYACAFLIKVCAEMGYLKEATIYEQRTLEMIKHFPKDPFLHMIYYSGKGYIGWFSGDKNKLYEAGNGIVNYGREVMSLRCQMVGYLLLGVRHSMDLDMDPAIEYAKKVITQGDPYHAVFAKLVLGMFLVHKREFEMAADSLNQVIAYSEKHGTDYMKSFANLFLGVALAACGDLAEGLRRIESSKREFIEFQRNIFYGLSEFILGSFYLQLYQRSGSKSLSTLFKNLGFLIKNMPFAGKKAESHLFKAIELARETGAKGFLGQPCLQMGLLYKLRGKMEKAKEYLMEAREVFEECELKVYTKRTQELLDSLT
jgi:class 3 adenylate cyclase/tetratricopeptide (TPR) repeat protein